MEIQEINFDTIPSEFQPEAMYPLPKGEFQIRCEEFKKYCADNKIFYYARPREDFFMYEAYELAEKAGCVYLLAEDMS